MTTVYKDGWLSDFFTALEENSDWLTVSTPGGYLETHAPLGRATCPLLSYTEMMEWALPRAFASAITKVLKEFSPRPEVLCFLSWRFLARFFFANIPNPICCTRKCCAFPPAFGSAPVRHDGSKTNDELLQARDLLLRAQCNDAYWHGIFGGIYAPHLRTDPWRNLIRAEAIADRQIPGALVPRVELLDYDADGTNELLFTSLEAQVLFEAR